MKKYCETESVKEKNKLRCQKWSQENNRQTVYVDKRTILETKKCTNCMVEKDISEFYYRKDRENYHCQCKDCCSESRKNRRDKINQNRRSFYKNNPGARIQRGLQSRLHSLVKNSISSSTTLTKYIGCSYNILLLWLEFQLYDNMTMENYGNVWHIDHCNPCSAYNFNNDSDIKSCFNWKNLRPLKQEKNLAKGSKISTHDIVLQELKSFVFEKNILPDVTKTVTEP